MPYTTVFKYGWRNGKRRYNLDLFLSDWGKTGPNKVFALNAANLYPLGTDLTSVSFPRIPVTRWFLSLQNICEALRMLCSSSLSYNILFPNYNTHAVSVFDLKEKLDQCFSLLIVQMDLRTSYRASSSLVLVLRFAAFPRSTSTCLIVPVCSWLEPGITVLFSTGILEGGWIKWRVGCVLPGRL